MLKPGNIVKFKDSIFFSPDMKFVVVEEEPDGYILANMDNGAKSGWWKEEELELIDNGDKIFVNTLSMIWDNSVSERKSIKWIKDNWDGKLKLNWNSILFLYEKIGYNVKINTTEEFEFYWYVLYPVFREVFFGTKRKALREVKKAFGDNRKMFESKVSDLYEEVRNE